mmetsp:Transcript_51537/g.164830  ORF Transcript_51537/g.164830 Transcript_51537/m.164830 type:complete len:537 (-) Transcript_51537:147-1757(-)
MWGAGDESLDLEPAASQLGEYEQANGYRDARESWFWLSESVMATTGGQIQWGFIVAETLDLNVTARIVSRDNALSTLTILPNGTDLEAALEGARVGGDCGPGTVYDSTDAWTVVWPGVYSSDADAAAGRAYDVRTDYLTRGAAVGPRGGCGGLQDCYVWASADDEDGMLGAAWMWHGFFHVLQQVYRVDSEFGRRSGDVALQGLVPHPYTHPAGAAEWPAAYLARVEAANASHTRPGGARGRDFDFYEAGVALDVAPKEDVHLRFRVSRVSRSEDVHGTVYEIETASQLAGLIEAGQIRLLVNDTVQFRRIGRHVLPAALSVHTTESLSIWPSHFGPQGFWTLVAPGGGGSRVDPVEFIVALRPRTPVGNVFNLPAYLAPPERLDGSTVNAVSIPRWHREMRELAYSRPPGQIQTWAYLKIFERGRMHMDPIAPIWHTGATLAESLWMLCAAMRYTGRPLHDQRMVAWYALTRLPSGPAAIFQDGLRNHTDSDLSYLAGDLEGEAREAWLGVLGGCAFRSNVCCCHGVLWFPATVS